MTAAVAITTVLIVLARIVDMSLDTVRTVSIMQGRRLFAASLGFVQALIYICAIAKVLQDMSHPTYAVAYALGFALGTYLGITVEQRLAFGNQVAALYTRKGAELAKVLAAAGFRVAQVHEHLRDGDGDRMSILYVELPRRQVRLLMRQAAAIDERCYCIVNDIRVAGFAPQHAGGAARNKLWPPPVRDSRSPASSEHPGPPDDRQAVGSVPLSTAGQETHRVA